MHNHHNDTKRDLNLFTKNIKRLFGLIFNCSVQYMMRLRVARQGLIIATLVLLLLSKKIIKLRNVEFSI